MAFTSRRAQAQFGSNVSAATVTFSPDADIEVGDLICLAWAINVNNVTVSTLADNSTQSGSANTYTNNTARATTAHSGGTAYCVATRKILTTDVVTVTLSAAGTRRSGNLGAFVPANGNPALDIVAGVTADTSSPVGYSTGTLSKAASLIVPFGQWRGGGQLSGWSGFGAGGWANLTSATSGGTTARNEVNSRYNLNIGSTSSVALSDSYSTITTAHGEVMVWNDEVPNPPPRSGIIVVRRTWARA